MNILLVADLHYALKQFDWVLSVAADHDAVVIAGDLLETASVVPQDAQIVVVSEYLRRLAKITRVFVCSGNHDLDAEGPGGERVAGWLARLGVAGVVRDGQSVAIGATLVSCFAWWEGVETRKVIDAQMERDAARRIGTGAWIWVHHAPPRDSPVSWNGRRSYGDEALSEWIARFSPSLVLSGHVHEAPFVEGGRWVDRIGGTWAFNAGRQIGEAPAHGVIDTGQSQAAWFSLAGRERVCLCGDEARPEPMTDLPDWLTGADRGASPAAGSAGPGVA